MYKLIFSLKFLFNILFYHVGIIKENYCYNNLKEQIISAGPIFTKIMQLLLVNNIKINEENNILLDILDCVHPVKKLNKININGKNYKVVNNFSMNSGSVAHVYLIKDFESNGLKIEQAILKKPIENLEEQINKSISELKYLFSTLKFFIKIGLIKNLKNKFINIKSNKDIIMNLNFSNEFETKIKNSIIDQTNMIKEGKNQIKFYEKLKNNNLVNVPEVYYFDKNNLIMEYTPGKKIPNYLKENPHEEKKLFNNFFLIILSMINCNLLHCDLHYGNILINEENKFNLIDYGIIKEISDDTKNKLIKILFNKDKDKNRDYLTKFTCEILNIDCNGINTKNKYETINLLKSYNYDVNTLNFILNISILNKLKKNNKKFL